MLNGGLQMRILFGLLLVALSGTASAVTYEELLEKVDEPMRVVKTKGIVRAINLTERTGEISGYTYHFGPAVEETPVKVKLYGRDYGAVELLTPGMKVEVVYFEPGGGRIAVRIEELHPDEEIDH
jgi:hypothetical protein